jgi:outer membrane protein
MSDYQHALVAATVFLMAAAPGVTATVSTAPSETSSITVAAPAHEAEELDQLLSRRPLVNGPLTIERATEIALRESPVVRGAVEEVEAAVGRLRAARAQTRPQLSATSFGTGGSESNVYATTDPVRPTNIFVVPRGAFFDQNATLVVPLYTGGRLRALVRQAAVARGMASADLEAVRQEVAVMTRTAYREVLARRAAIDVARAVVADSQERLRGDRSRAAAGAIPPFYVQRDEAEVANAQQQLTNAERDAEISLVQLKTVMGVHPDSHPDPAGPLGFEPAATVIERLAGTAPTPASEGQPLPRMLPPAASPTDGGTGPTSAPSETPVSPLPSLAARYRARLLPLAERQRPELQAARLRVEQAAQGISVARSAYLPQVGIGAMADFMTSTHASTFGGASFGLTASLPLFDSGLRRDQLQSAEAERRHRQQDFERTALEVEQQVTNALLSLGAAEQNVATAQAGARAAQQEYQVALQRYQAGRGILVEALDALAARTRAETNVIQALYEYNVAQDQLRRAIGQPVAPAAASVP